MTLTCCRWDPAYYTLIAPDAPALAPVPWRSPETPVTFTAAEVAALAAALRLAGGEGPWTPRVPPRSQWLNLRAVTSTMDLVTDQPWTWPVEALRAVLSAAAVPRPGLEGALFALAGWAARAPDLLGAARGVPSHRDLRRRTAAVARRARALAEELVALTAHDPGGRLDRALGAAGTLTAAIGAAPLALEDLVTALEDVAIALDDPALVAAAPRPRGRRDRAGRAHWLHHVGLTFWAHAAPVATRADLQAAVRVVARVAGVPLPSGVTSPEKLDAWLPRRPTTRN